MAAPTPLPTGNQFGMQGPQYSSPYAGMPAGTQVNEPIMPEFNSPWNSSMAEAPQMAQMLNGVQLNTQPLTNLENYASDPNASPWAQASDIQSYQQQNEAGSNLAGQTAGSVAGANANLATQGGLSSGAREGDAQAGIRSDVSGQQGIATQGMGQRSQVGINDASNKLQAQEALPGMETQQYQAELEPIQMYGQAYGQDVANQMNATNAGNAFNMSAFNTEGQLYGAGQQANAIAAAQADQDSQSFFQRLGL